MFRRHIHAIDDKLAVSAPRQSAEVAFPMKLHTGVGAVVQLLCHMLVHDRELELVRLDGALYLGILQTCLDHLALVGLEKKALFLEIVDVTFVHGLAVHEAEFDKDKCR